MRGHFKKHNQCGLKTHPVSNFTKQMCPTTDKISYDKNTSGKSTGRYLGTNTRNYIFR